VWVSATGSDRALWLQGSRASFTAQTLDAGIAPAGAVITPDGLAALNRLDDSVRLYLPDARGSLTLRATRALDRPTRTTLADLGERLFYGALLWQQRPDARFTCNSCHWEGGTDHRLQPGFHEKRQELTRPLGGIAGVRPIFTPGQAPNLTLAVEGLLRGLDERMWQAEPPPRYWEYPVDLRLADGSQRQLAPLEVRSALLEFLLQLPAEPGHLRATREPALQAEQARGAALFARDCARCHEPVTSLHTRQRVADAQLLARLRTRPLVLGAAAFAEVGAGPSFTPAGNRISPLLNLSRGGPYFASGSARSLAELIERFTPGSSRCHGGSATSPAYDAGQRADLETFLRSL
jgi:cytochrome c peroxidase